MKRIHNLHPSIAELPMEATNNILKILFFLWGKSTTIQTALQCRPTFEHLKQFSLFQLVTKTSKVPHRPCSKVT